MTIQFDLGKIAKNLQTLGNSMLGNGLLLAATQQINRGGFYGPSIWGCSGGFIGCTPPLSIFHPMYSSMNYNPYLTQAGLQVAAQAGAEMMDQALAQQNQLIQPAENVEKTENDFSDIEASSEFENKMTTGEDVTFVTSAWSKKSNKDNLSTEEQKALKDSYKKSVSQLGYSHTKYIDQEYGNDDNKITIDELKNYIKAKNPDEDDSTIEQYAQNILKTLDINADENISGDEMTALMAYIDEFGENKKADGKISPEDFNFATYIMQDNGELNTSFGNRIKESHENLFSE